MPDLDVGKEQLAAIQHRTGAMLVLAGPGSGKTFVITQRIRYLIQEYQINPNLIYVITFTKAAALEMQGRFEAATVERYPVHFGTFHSMFFSILRNAHSYQVDNIITEKEKHEYLYKILTSYLPLEEIQNDTIAAVLVQIGRRKNAMHSETEEFFILESNAFEAVYQEYQESMKKNRKLDFDDMVFQCETLFKQRPDMLSVWQKKVQYLLIDEVQDINEIQYRLVRMLAEPDHNLFIVGDDDQAIYGFRGARPDFMMQFEKDFPGAEKILLPYNYRCVPEIVKASLAVIGENKIRIPKEISSAREENGRVVVSTMESKEKEYEFLTGQLRKYSSEEMEQTALLFRTNSQMQEMGRQLIGAGIPFWMKEKIQNPFLGEAVLDVTAYLKLSQGELGRKEFLRIMNKPNRFLERRSLQSEAVTFQELYTFYAYSEEKLQTLNRLEKDIGRIAGMTPYAAVNYIRKGIGYENFWKEKRNKEELEEQAVWFQQYGKPYRSIRELLEHILDFNDRLKKEHQRNTQEGKGIRLMTLHASKGLEFDRIYLPGLNEGVMPHKKSMTEEQLEEERRMLYVGMTRARKELYLSYVSGDNKEKPEAVSRFLHPILPL